MGARHSKAAFVPRYFGTDRHAGPSPRLDLLQRPTLSRPRHGVTLSRRQILLHAFAVAALPACRSSRSGPPVTTSAAPLGSVEPGAVRGDESLRFIELGN